MSHYDVIVIGTGSMGSAACYWLAKKGCKVLGLEQFSIPHELGAHAGQSRIIRKAYFEHPDYVPLLDKAYKNWQALEHETGQQLYHQTGLVYMGPPGHQLIEGVRRAASLYNILLENLDASSFNQRFSPFTVPPSFHKVFEPEAGFIIPETAVQLMTGAALKYGGIIQQKEKVVEWKKMDGKYKVTTDKGEYTAGKLVITAGAWTNKILPDLPASVHVTRQVVAWVQPPKREKFMYGNFPCWLLEDPDRGIYYGFPVLPPDKFEGPSALKLAHHFPGQITQPDEVDRNIHPADEEDIRYALEKYLPSAGHNIVQWKTCLYANSKDENFIIDHLPGYENDISIACGFSGHGFKFAPAIGEILSELALQGKTNSPIGFLSLDRFSKEDHSTSLN